MSITIKDISNLSGYSVSTVSKALNDKYEIGEATKREIQEIARLNNYVPNNSARALRNRKTKIIAVIVPRITSPYFNTFTCIVQKKASKIGYRVIVSQSFSEESKEKECVAMLTDGSVDGIILLSNNEDQEKVFPNMLTVPYPENEDDFEEDKLKVEAYEKFKKLISIIG